MSNTLAGYETTFITRNDMGDDALATLINRLKGVVKTHEGEMIHEEDWGRRKLAYKIKKETRGRYSHLVYTGNPAAVAEMERTLRLTETVLRFLSVKIGDEVSVEEIRKARLSKTKKKEAE